MKRILLVEDNGLTQDLVRDILTGYDLQIAASGAEALRLCREALPDLLILDLNLVTPPDRTRRSYRAWNCCADYRWPYPSSS